ncbi:hypothetical protein KPH14_002665 [Odynerus spinipes]|uniref:Uncharacterized protein n=1 Tax=Odynerus spinipes TaxID=1348599 RepID=A0AAD9RFZ2_9HYME|nr:hypothetical protein KPH14_002665 [Odynerus spinipes]
MIIPIKRNLDIQEWTVIELQGELSFDSRDVPNNHYIGDLHFTISVLKKIPTILIDKASDKASKTEYNVQAIVKKKIIFKVRPKPIVTNVLNA